MLTLTSFRKLNEVSRGVNVSEEPTMYAIFSSERLKTFMERIKTGEPIASRELAAKAGVAHGTIGALMSGTQRVVPEPKAQAIADAIGVELLVLWVEMERAGRTFIPAQTRATA
jgi:transcriptional regulator with XRE-family HTH domain